MAPTSRRARTDYIRMGTTSAGHSQLNLCWEAEVALNTTVCGIQKVDLGEEGEAVLLAGEGVASMVSDKYYSLALMLAYIATCR